MLRRSTADKKIKFTSRTLWNQPKDKKDCYFCMTNIVGFKNSNTQKIKYANVSSVTKPTLCCDEHVENIKTSENTEVVDKNVVSALKEIAIEKWNTRNTQATAVRATLTITMTIPPGQQKKPEFYTQESLNDLIRDLGLPKDAAENLASNLKERNLVMKGTQSTVYRTREKVFLNFFSPNVYKDEEWRLFIDSSQRSLKAVLIHNTNKFASIPIAHYHIEGKLWMICGDLKIVTILLGQQSGFTKHPCFLCLWNSRDRKNHYKKQKWPERS